MEERFQNIPLNALTPFPFSARVAVDEEKLLELAETIKANGLLEPLIVRPSKTEPNKYEIVCGYRRLKAAEMAGLDAVPCVVKDLSDADALAAIFVENVQREDFTDYELGKLLKTMMERHPSEYPTQEKVAKRTNMSRQMVSALILHYEAVEDLRKQLPPNIATRVAMLPEGIIREIRRAPLDAQPTLVKAYLKSVDDGTPLGVRDMAKMVDKLLLKTSQEKAEEETKEMEKKFLESEEAEKPTITEKPKPSAKEKELEAAIEKQRKSIMAEKRKAKAFAKLDQDGRIYLMLTNYFPEMLVNFLDKHLDFSKLTEKEAIAITKDLVEGMATRLTNNLKNGEALLEILKEAIAWH